MSAGGLSVCYVGPLPPIRGGIAQHGARLVGALRELGVRVQLLSWAAQYPRRLYRGQERDPGLPALPDTAFLLRWWNPVSWWRAGARARTAHLLVVPFHTPLQAPMYWAVAVAARGVPAVCVVHNPRPHERRSVDAALTRLLFRRLRGAVVHAQSLRTDMEHLAPRLPVEVVPHPPNFALTPTPLPAGPPWRLLFFGFVRPYKGLDLAIDALAALRQRGVDAVLTVRGDFWEPVEDWQQRVRARGLDRAVRLVPGYVPDDEVGPLFAEHHLLIAPYRSATQSGIVPLAFAAGRAVVATRVGGLADVVVDGHNGILVEPDAPTHLGDAIVHAVERLPGMTVAAAASATSWTDLGVAVLRAGGLVPPQV